ncbi:ABC transporter substrate-binding protein [Rhizobacter sp. Root1221]|uniref:ABC transporter substrate-binding protein n=1 Tax=Rhizobacter sp. Root1221 TaxID=1736433 RepID=UPI0006F1E380|nr:ABC transporter substrate-binding protein [Rhizobacter sp. Root1221]KQV90484.1 hypothetical protein ASC87_27965 [Rhizobacter sp. Root1221]
MSLPTMHSFRRLAVSALVLAQGLLSSVPLLAAPPPNEPIRVGSVSTLTGPGSTVAWRAAKAYFDAVNAAGGVGGRRIDYQVLDDRADPQAAQQAAARLVADPGVVALAGGSSVLECAFNHAVYEKAGLMSIPGAGVDPACFGSPAIAPVNAGPYVSTANALSFARDVLKHDRLCVVAPALPGMVDAFRDIVARWAIGRAGTPPTIDLYRIEAPLDGIVQQVAARRCQAVIYSGPEGLAIDWVLKARAALGGVDHVFLASVYTSGVLRAVGVSGEGIYVLAEFEPWSGSSLQLADWRGLMLARGIEASSLSQGGYLAAQVLVKVMRGIRGPITRASVTEALRTMQPIANSLADEPFVFGPASQHQPHRSALPLRLTNGRWRIAHARWVRFEPKAEAPGIPFGR